MVKKDSGVGREILRWVVTILTAVLVSVGVRTYLFSAYSIPSTSMADTLLVGDRVMVNKLDRSFEPGDVVVFKAHDGFKLPGDPDVYIKRVVAVAGDTVECCNASGQVLVNGEAVVEDYVTQDDHLKFAAVEVPENHLWVMGDNRPVSSDSRYRGVIREDEVVGVASLRFWPLNRIGTF